MIVVDTNIISELMKPEPHPGMRHWMNAQSSDNLYLTSVSWYELLYGLELMPSGKRRDGLRFTLNALRTEFFADRMLSFDENSASALSKLMAQARVDGIAISLGDGQIASIAVQHGFSVATRDTLPFEAAGLQVINPWGLI
jgi:toxin FitB